MRTFCATVAFLLALCLGCAGPGAPEAAVNRAMAQEAATPEIAPVSESGGLAFSTPRPSQTEPPLVEVPEESEEALPWTYPISREILDDEQDVLRLVNANNLLDKDYPGEDMLVEVTVRKANSNEMLARAVASEALQAMFDAADEDGLICTPPTATTARRRSFTITAWRPWATTTGLCRWRAVPSIRPAWPLT